ncbi:MAG: GatB/YqeY domain-containing protein [Candidatus Brocadiae bacterium]|nr:GatB/YqeY domain-containing protein [Candidatus Brocadiia bacterium]
MSVRDVLADQMKRALKGRQTERLRALRMLRAELQVAETSGKEFKETDVVKSHAKKLRKNVEEYEQLGLTDRAEAIREELAVVEEFLPPQMSRDELGQQIAALIEENDYGPRDIGKVMKALMSEHADVVDGRLAREIAAEKLAEGR